MRGNFMIFELSFMVVDAERVQAQLPLWSEAEQWPDAAPCWLAYVFLFIQLFLMNIYMPLYNQEDQKILFLWFLFNSFAQSSSQSLQRQ